MALSVSAFGNRHFEDIQACGTHPESRSAREFHVPISAIIFTHEPMTSHPAGRTISSGNMVSTFEQASC